MYLEAIEAYEKALSISPEEVDVRVDMASCFRALGRYNEAHTQYRKALRLEPDHGIARLNFGILLAYEQNNISAALPELERFLELEPAHKLAEKVREEVNRLTLKRSLEKSH